MKSPSSHCSPGSTLPSPQNGSTPVLELELELEGSELLDVPLELVGSGVVVADVGPELALIDAPAWTPPAPAPE